jgi:peptidoglycan biosynthesis protein MviN/MurJ (putative lipid II flippase)
MSAVQVPLILIGSLAASTEVGFLMLGMRLMQAPVGLIGSSISQVFFSQAVDAHRRDELPELVTKSLSALLKTGVGPADIRWDRCAVYFWIYFRKGVAACR